MAEAFARRLQAALQQHDVPAVAALVAFPLRLNGPGRARRQLGRAQFMREFDRVFTPAVVQQVLAQDPTNLFQRDQGVMFGLGEVWAAAVCAPRQRSGCPVRVYVVNRTQP